MTAWEETKRSGRLQTLLAIHNWNKLLDIGCGDGDMLSTIKDFYPKSALIGVDKNICKPNALKKEGISYITGDACSLTDFDDNRFDFVVSTGVLEHVTSDTELIEEAFRVLRPGGVFFLATVFKKPWAWHFYKAPCGWALDPTHLREYTTDRDVLFKLRKAGFLVLESSKLWTWRHIGPLWFPTLGYYCWELVAFKNEKGGR